MPRQMQPRAERLPSVQTSAQAKLGSVLEVLRERAVSANTAHMKLKSFATQALGQNGKLALGAACFERVGHQEQSDGLGRGKVRTCIHRSTGLCQVTLPSGPQPAREPCWVSFVSSRPQSAKKTDPQAGRTSPGSCDARVRTSTGATDVGLVPGDH